jgi:hypothetical protein
MNVRRLLRTAAKLGVSGPLLAHVTCASQPAVRCTLLTSQSNDAIGLFTPVGPPRAVAGAPSNACDAVIAAQGLPTYAPPGPMSPGPDPRLLRVGFEVFFPSPSDPNETTTPNAVAIKAEWIGDRIQDAQVNAATDPAASPMQATALASYPYPNGDAPAPPPADAGNTRRPYAFGRFDSVYPDANDLCSATLAASEMDYPDVPAHKVSVSIPGDGSYASAPGTQPDSPQTHVRYEWTNFRAIVSAESLGLQAFANLTVTRDGCAADYQVSLLTPRVPCAKLDGMGNPVMPPSGDATLCSPDAAPTNPYGSGIHPGIAVSCENVGGDANPDFECMPTRIAP